MTEEKTKPSARDVEALTLKATSEAIRAIGVTIEAMQAADIAPISAMAGLAMLVAKIARGNDVNVDSLRKLMDGAWAFAADEEGGTPWPVQK